MLIIEIDSIIGHFRNKWIVEASLMHSHLHYLKPLLIPIRRRKLAKTKAGNSVFFKTRPQNTFSMNTRKPSNMTSFIVNIVKLITYP